MTTPPRFELMASCPPGLEPWLLDEVHERGWSRAQTVPGGVTWQGTWADIWRANLLLRGASRVLMRLGRFRALHLNELEGQVAELPLGLVVGDRTPVRAEAVCRRSKIYHSGAAEERVLKAAARFGGLTKKDGVAFFIRIENNHCTVSVDTSGLLLHQRGFKQAVAGAPLRETSAALMLRACGYSGDEPFLDPMCGSGTLALEAADLAAGLAPARARSFAFERFATFDETIYAPIRQRALDQPRPSSPPGLWASDRSAGAINAARQNAERAGTAALLTFSETKVSQSRRPEGPPGLVLVNPPYGNRLGDKTQLQALYQSFGNVMAERFAGWRVGLITSDNSLAKATRLPWHAPGPWWPHGGLRVRLWQTPPLS